MGQTFRQTLLMAAVFVLFIGSHNAVAFADDPLSGKATINGAIYCITADGEMHEIEGGCPNVPIAYLLITDDGVVYVLNKGIETPEPISELALKAIRADKAKGNIFLDQRRWWLWLM